MYCYLLYIYMLLCVLCVCGYYLKGGEFCDRKRFYSRDLNHTHTKHRVAASHKVKETNCESWIGSQ